MLTWNYVLQRIHDNIDFGGTTGIEKTDDELIAFCKRSVLQEWSYFYPSTNRISLNTYDENVRVPKRTSCFYLFDPEGREIKNIKAMYNDSGSLMLFGHDVYGAFNYEQVPEIALANQQARNTLLYSPYNYTCRFYPPNICEIMPHFEGTCTVEYERAIAEDLSDVTPDLTNIFTDLCVAKVEMWIGKNRMKFSTYNTQFGEISLNGENLYTSGKETYEKIIEKLGASHACMNTIFDVG